MITAQQVYDIMAILPDDKDNPSPYGTCVYTDPHDRNNHCIAGEVISRLGYRLPDTDSYMNEESLYELLDNKNYTLSDRDFEPLALAMLVKAQGIADHATGREEENPWGRAKKCAFDIYNLDPSFKEV